MYVSCVYTQIQYRPGIMHIDITVTLLKAYQKPRYNDENNSHNSVSANIARSAAVE